VTFANPAAAEHAQKLGLRWLRQRNRVTRVFHSVRWCPLLPPQVAPGPPLLLDLVRPRRVVALVFSQVAHLVSWPVFVARLLDHAFIVSGDGKRSGVLETQALTVTLKELVSFVFQLNTQHTLDSNLPRVPS